MAELVTRAADPDSGLPVHTTYSAAVNPPRRTIVLAVFGLTDEDIYDNNPDAPAQAAITHHAQPVLDDHNWTNPNDPTDYRFTATLVVFDHAEQARLVERGRGPGTVCVITEDRDGWWNA